MPVVATVLPDLSNGHVTHLGLRGLVLCDPDRSPYRLVGLRRAAVWQVYSPRTLAFYGRAILRGRRLHAPVEDTRQLGGDALVVDGVLTRRWRPSTPEDRAAPHLLVSAARAAMSESDGGGGPVRPPGDAPPG